MRSFLFGGSSITTNDGATVVETMDSAWDINNDAPGVCGIPFPEDVLVECLYVAAKTPLAGGSLAVKVRNNQVDTALLASIAAGSSSASVYAPVKFLAGDPVSLYATFGPGVTAGPDILYASLRCSGAAQPIMAMLPPVPTVGTNYYMEFMGSCNRSGSSSAVSTVSTDIGTIVPVHGTLRNFRFQAQSTTGPFTVTLMLNDSPTAIVAGPGESGSDLTHTVAVVPGDKVSWRVNNSGASTGLRIGVGIAFVPDSTLNPNTAWFGQASSTNDLGGYQQLLGIGANSGSWQVDESYQDILGDATITDLYVKRGAAPGAGASHQWILRTNNTDTDARITFSGASQSEGHVSGLGVVVSPTDKLNNSSIRTNSPTSATTRISYGYQAASPVPPQPNVRSAAAMRSATR